jgi:hypothetical protein
VGVELAPGARRNFMTSACGTCGKASIEDICVLPHAPLPADTARFAPDMLAAHPDRLRGPGRGGGPDPGRLPARPVDERLHRGAPAVGRCLPDFDHATRIRPEAQPASCLHTMDEIPVGQGKFARGELIDVQPMPGALW